jgi:hypothetical protein
MYRLNVYVYKPLPPGVYPIAVDKYININTSPSQGAVLKCNMVKLFTAPSQDTDRWLALANEVMNRAANFFLTTEELLASQEGIPYKELFSVKLPLNMP